MSDVHVPWGAVVRHAKERIEAIRSALEAAPADRITGLQAEIKTWRAVLDLPETLAIPVMDDRAAY